jgi:hypothetical protein
MSSRSRTVTMTPDVEPDTADACADTEEGKTDDTNSAADMTMPDTRATKKRRGLIAASR